MPSWVMMALGAYRFALSTAAYQEFQRITEYTWPIHARAGKPPLLQFTGGGNDQIILRGLIFPEFRGGTAQIDDMRLEAGLGISVPLISGFGNYYGMFAIGMIEERQTEFWPDGTVRVQEFIVTLIRYNQISITIPGTSLSVSPNGLLGAVVGG